ncbi:MAG TPA: hypothetical protein ENH82_03180 [bacterium]|nr:hypothetical protein [bacterium]
MKKREIALRVLENLVSNPSPIKVDVCLAVHKAIEKEQWHDLRKKSEEQLADYAHAAWSGWMKYMFEKMSINNNGTASMPKWAVDRWAFQMNTAYNRLPEKMKESDRQEANRIITIVKNSLARTTNF